MDFEDRHLQYAIKPMSIVLHSIFRQYSAACLLGAWVLCICFLLHQNPLSVIKCLDKAVNKVGTYFCSFNRQIMGLQFKKKKKSFSRQVKGICENVLTDTKKDSLSNVFGN